MLMGLTEKEIKRQSGMAQQPLVQVLALALVQALGQVQVQVQVQVQELVLVTQQVLAVHQRRLLPLVTHQLFYLLRMAVSRQASSSAQSDRPIRHCSGHGDLS